MRFSRQIFLYWLLPVFSVALVTSCSPSGSTQNTTDPGDLGPSVSHSFRLTWPLEDPLDEERANMPLLLRGHLQVQTMEPDSAMARMRLRVTLIRPDDDEFREFWNKSLKYEHYAWMGQVRVMDKDGKWLYPNLAYLFKLHGVDRVGRYGGWDPGKQVDNDFGAVLIRIYDADSGTEIAETTQGPLVSADWHADDGRGISRYDVVHQARSDDFTIRFPRGLGRSPMRAKVWLVYGDFFDESAPRSWPLEPEAAGGSLAFFTVDWDCDSRTPDPPVIRQQTPEPTGFDWVEWIGRPSQDVEPIGKPRLSVTLESDGQRLVPL